MAEKAFVQNLVHKLQAPIPQYVLGCLPAIATIGASPISGFSGKLVWMLRCLACPFTGLLYNIIVNNDGTSLCAYWMDSEHFIIGSGDEEKFGKYEEISFRPVGIYFKKPIRGKFTKKIIDECTAQASVLERLASLPPAYYMLVGIISGISRMSSPGPRACEDWPYIPVALCWTIPAIFRRIFGGILVVKDPNEKFQKYNDKFKENKRNRVIRKNKVHKILVKQDDNPSYCYVILTALVSIGIPWVSVFLAYSTPPVGFRCRSAYLSLLCSLWSFNSALGFIYHVKRETTVIGNKNIHTWFFICGVLVAILLFCLVLLSTNNSWWVDLFGKYCSNSGNCIVF